LLLKPVPEMVSSCPATFPLAGLIELTVGRAVNWKNSLGSKELLRMYRLLSE
jgi:hypothetical protein